VVGLPPGPWGRWRGLLLDGGADPTIGDDVGTTPTAVAKQRSKVHFYSEGRQHGGVGVGRRDCVAALEVSFRLLLFLPQH
jgi:hypothetical protein